MAEYEGDDIDEGRDDDRVLEWETGLPSTDDLMPLSQLLVPPALAVAFSISPEPYRSDVDVDRASQKTLSELKVLSSICDYENTDNSRKSRRIDPNFTDDPSNRASKRARLVWTPQLHKRFVDVVAHLGIKNAVPKTIMQLMNVEGLTRENVASHLQKYRIYLKRFSNDEPSSSSSSDHPALDCCRQGDPLPLAIPFMYPPPVMPMAVLMNTPMANSRTQQRDWWGSKSNHGN